MNRIFIFAALGLTAMSAHAADNGIYLGLGASRTDFDIPGAADQTDTGYKAIAGVRLLDSLGVELNYADHGEARLAPGATVEAKSASAFAVGFLDFPIIDLFGKVGLSYTDSSFRSVISPDSDSSTDFAWGAGVQAHFLSFGVRAEYERFKVYGDRDLGVISASLIYTFL